MQKEIIAAIDVGSHALRMKIGELKNNGDFRELENFRRVAALGHDTFTNSKVSFESVDKVCDILKTFKSTMNDYGIKVYKAMATSAIREASNREYIVDQIKLKTDLDISVIDNSEEQFLTHKAIKYKLENFDQIIMEGAVIVVIGAGSIQITLYKDGHLISSQNVKMGALRIKEIIGALENETLKYNKILDEYINVNLEGLDFFKKGMPYQHFIAVGGEMSSIKKLISSKDSNHITQEIMQKSNFRKLLNNIASKSTEELSREYSIKKERAEILIPSMMLFNKFLDQIESEVIIIPNISLNDGIVRDIYEDLNKLNKKDKAIADIITNARVIAEKFEYNKEHAEIVEKNALILFDKLKKLHGLENERVLLKCSAILHDIGKFIGLDKHYLHSYNIIRSLEIFGLSKEQMELIANVCRYHSNQVPEQQQSFRLLPEKDRVLVSKLVAILKLANSLDRSHKQKVVIQSVKLKDKELMVRAVGNEKSILEEWEFKVKAAFFQEVFGITPVLKVKNEIE
ncbi:MAG: hypothetical protein CVU84_07390 [Firmicutes bacterium HGW-Firmicutes-1]|nr:MAG: hypothetical protein CVU84_07390 [Firmicutes bacterium HGW-Firmicutes-1]